MVTRGLINAECASGGNTGQDSHDRSSKREDDCYAFSMKSPVAGYHSYHETAIAVNAKNSARFRRRVSARKWCGQSFIYYITSLWLARTCALAIASIDVSPSAHAAA